MTLRFEIFPPDLDAAVDFYTRVLHFGLTKDQREDPEAYVAMKRGNVLVGAARRAVPDAHQARLPPTRVELRMATRRRSPGSSLGPEGLPDPRSRRVLPSDHQSGAVTTSAHCSTERSFWHDADGHADRHDATHIEPSARVERPARWLRPVSGTWVVGRAGLRRAPTMNDYSLDRYPRSRLCRTARSVLDWPPQIAGAVRSRDLFPFPRSLDRQVRPASIQTALRRLSPELIWVVSMRACPCSSPPSG
jgi:catechol 2,3-dioxygenase-like lactoylglutathione lyase family enzyme